MRNELIDTLERLYGKNEINSDVADYAIKMFTNELRTIVVRELENFNFSIYDHPSFNRDVKAETIGIDVAELLLDSADSLQWNIS